MPITTLCELFLEAAARDKQECLLHKVEGRYVPISTADFVRDVHRLAHALEQAGIERGDRVALMAENGPHWPTVDFATLCVGAVLVPIYPTLQPDQAAYIARDSGSKIVFAQGHERLEGLVSQLEEMPDARQLVLIGGEASGEKVTCLSALLRAGEGADPAEIERKARMARPEDLATLIYTSGTTGQPKGVMLTHGNITSNILASLSVLELAENLTALSFLPLSHSFERTVDYIYFYRGLTIGYAESVQTVGQNLGEVKPHVFVAVPRVYEKVLSRIYENVSKGSPLKQKIFHWAVDVGRQATPYRLRQEPIPGLLGIKAALADKLVFGKIRERLGGRFEMALSGAAPLARDVAEFFWGAGIPVFEGYGLTETSPVLSVNVPNAVKLGTVGRPIPGVEIHIAEDGEILARGPNIMQGYYNLPDATAETLDAEGWFHTGDVGQLDGDDFLSITDRKKELIVNAYGKNVAPAPIENTLKGSRYIAEAVVLGDRRKFLAALLVPDFEALQAWAAERGVSPAELPALVRDPEVRELYEGEVAAVNERLARYEQIRAWELLPREFSQETGELTPTMKVKRRVINSKYGDIIESLYEAAEAKTAKNSD